MRNFGGLALALVDTPITLTQEEAVPPLGCVPDGYLTVAGWYIKYEPDLFDEMADPVGGLTRDVEELLSWCDRRDVDVIDVLPSPVARRFGFSHSRAFPEAVLTEFFARRC